MTFVNQYAEKNGTAQTQTDTKRVTTQVQAQQVESTRFVGG